MFFHVKKIFRAKQCQECKKYFKTKQESLMHLQNKHLIKLYMSYLWYQFQDEMLKKKTLTKKGSCFFFVTKFKIWRFQTYVTKSKTSRNEKLKLESHPIPRNHKLYSTYPLFGPDLSCQFTQDRKSFPKRCLRHSPLFPGLYTQKKTIFDLLKQICLTAKHIKK